MSDYLILSDRIFSLGLTGAEFRIIAAVADFGRYEFEMRIETMANRCGLSSATVRRTLPLLQSKRLLDVICREKSRGKKGKNSYRAYRLKMPHTVHFFRLKKSLVQQLSAYQPCVLLFYAYLVCKADRYGRAFGSDRGIAGKLHISRSTVRRCANILDSLGLVKKIDRRYKKSYQTKAHRTTEYDLPDLQPNSEKTDPQIRPVCGENNLVKANTLPDWFSRQNAKATLVADWANLLPRRLIFRPPRPPNLSLFCGGWYEFERTLIYPQENIPKEKEREFRDMKIYRSSLLNKNSQVTVYFTVKSG